MSIVGHRTWPACRREGAINHRPNWSILFCLLVVVADVGLQVVRVRADTENHGEEVKKNIDKNKMNELRDDVGPNIDKILQIYGRLSNYSAVQHQNSSYLDEIKEDINETKEFFLKFEKEIKNNNNILEDWVFELSGNATIIIGKLEEAHATLVKGGKLESFKLPCDLCVKDQNGISIYGILGIGAGAGAGVGVAGFFAISYALYQMFGRNKTYWQFIGFSGYRTTKEWYGAVVFATKPFKERLGNMMLWLALLLLLVIGGSVATFLFIRSKKPPPPPPAGGDPNNKTDATGNNAPGTATTTTDDGTGMVGPGTTVRSAIDEIKSKKKSAKNKSVVAAGNKSRKSGRKSTKSNRKSSIQAANSRGSGFDGARSTPVAKSNVNGGNSNI